MDELQQILENSKLTGKIIEDSLIHPVLQTTDYKPREVFSEISEMADIFFTTKRTTRMVGLAGLRGTGKTTLLWQIADYIYKNYTKNIYFFNIADLQNFDVGVKNIHRAFETYVVKSKLWSYKEPIVLLFDEIHEDPQWARALKVLSDDFRTSFILATGSSALLLQSTADLVTRMLIQHVYPLNFTEYLDITNLKLEHQFDKKEKLKEILFHSQNSNELYQGLLNIEKFANNYFSNINNLQDEILDYILYRNITRFSLLQVKTQINTLLIDLVRRVIYEDIPKMAKEINVHFSEKILRRIAASDEINLQTLSQSIGISQEKIIENLDILVKAELLNVLYPHGGIDSKINKAQKYFFMSPSIRKAILTPLIQTDADKSIYAKMLEDIVVLYLKRIFRDSNIISFSSEKGQRNPDLIIETLDNPIILEIGINKNTTKQISKSRIKYKYGIAVNSKIDKIELHNDIVIIPLKYFLLL